MDVFFTSLIKDLVPLFIIAGPLGAVPLFLAMTANDGAVRRRRTAYIAAVTCTLTLAAVALGGQALFSAFGITLDSFRIAGGVLLFLYSIDMVQSRTPRMKTTDEEMRVGVAKDEVGIIPLGIPMLAGPGAIATVMVLRLQGSPALADLWTLLVAVGLVGVLSAVIFLFAIRLERHLTPVVMGVIVRLEGLLLAAIAVQMLVDGITHAFGLPVSTAV
jgi:multiple antibiotic resistance protein